MNRQSKKPNKRAVVYTRDGFRCVYCGWSEIRRGREGPDGRCLTLDHVIPRSKGGSDDVDNLVTCCNICNSDKGSRRLTDWHMPNFGLNATRRTERV